MYGSQTGCWLNAAIVPSETKKPAGSFSFNDVLHYEKGVPLYKINKAFAIVLR